MSDLVERLRKRAGIRRQIATRKSVQEGKPDRIADLLEEAATEIESLKDMRGAYIDTLRESRDAALDVIRDCRDVFKREGYKLDSLGLEIARVLGPDSKSSDGGTFTPEGEIWKECATHPGTKFVYGARCPLCITDRNSPDWTCPICDGGPGNFCACTCPGPHL